MRKSKTPWTLWTMMRHPLRWTKNFFRAAVDLGAHANGMFSPFGPGEVDENWVPRGDRLSWSEADYADTDRDTGKTDGMEGYDGL